MALNPSFASTPRVEMVTISTANTNKDGSGTLATLFTAGSSGSRIERVIIKAQGTVTDGAIRFFLSDGTNHRLIHEEPVGATTGTGTNVTFTSVITTGFLPILLVSGQSLRVSTHNAETFNVIAIGGDF